MSDLKQQIWGRLVAMPGRCPVDGCYTVILGGTRDDWEEHWRAECNPLGALYEPGPEVDDGRR